jgi:hypothetical protein
VLQGEQVDQRPAADITQRSFAKAIRSDVIGILIVTPFLHSDNVDNDIGRSDMKATSSDYVGDYSGRSGMQAIHSDVVGMLIVTFSDNVSDSSGRSDMKAINSDVVGMLVVTT